MSVCLGMCVCVLTNQKVVTETRLVVWTNKEAVASILWQVSVCLYVCFAE